MIIECNERVTASRTAPDGLLKFTSALDMIQDCECVAVDSDTQFWGWFETHGMAMFVVSRVVEVARMPRYREALTVRTAPYANFVSLGRRYTEIVDAGGALCVSCHTVAAYVDLASGTPARVPRELAAAVELHPHPGDAPAKRKLSLNGGTNIGFSVTPVKRGDIDLNRHMNNVSYVEAALELLPPLEVRSMRVEYRSAAKLGDTLHCEVTHSVAPATLDDTLKVRGTALEPQRDAYTVSMTDSAGKTYAIIEMKN